MASIIVKTEPEPDVIQEEVHFEFEEIQDPLTALETNVHLRRKEIVDMFDNLNKVVNKKLENYLFQLDEIHALHKQDIIIKIKQHDDLKKSKSHLEQANIQTLISTVNHIDEELKKIESQIEEMKDIKCTSNMSSFEEAINDVLLIEHYELNSSYCPSPVVKSDPTSSIVRAKQEYSTLQNVSPGIDLPQINTPNAIVVDKQTGVLYIADRGNHCILAFTDSGECISIIKDPELRNPNRLSITDRYIYVTCLIDGQKKGNKLISSHLIKIDKIDHCPITILKLEERLLRICPYGAGIIVTDYVTHYARFYDSAMRLLSANKFVSPYFDNNTKIYDITLFNGELYLLSQGLRFPVQIFSIACEIMKCVQLSIPLAGAYYFCIDPNQLRIIISDTEANQIKVFNLAGECLCIVGPEGDISHDIVSPRGIDIDSNGAIFVCDMKEVNSIRLFKIT